MNDHDEDLFLEELRRLKPARPPQDFLDRLVRLPQAERPRQNTLRPEPPTCGFWQRFRYWLAPAAVAATITGLLIQRSSGPVQPPSVPPVVASTKPMLKADDIEIDRQLVASFDTVAQMPDGEPVRFRFREWSDELIMRDSGRGVVIEQRTPRLEIVPVRFEVY
jgi:hypothetical protein